MKQTSLSVEISAEEILALPPPPKERVAAAAASTSYSTIDRFLLLRPSSPVSEGMGDPIYERRFQ
jgi:hypothetical protein